MLTFIRRNPARKNHFDISKDVIKLRGQHFVKVGQSMFARKLTSQ